MSLFEEILSMAAQHSPRREAREARGARDAAQLAPLVLAYMGDTVYDLYVRTILIQKSDATAHGLHVLAAGHVRASAQARACESIMPLLTEKELSIFRRARNAHMGTVPKSASIAEYRAATGLEAVIGFLYLSGEDARLHELMSLILQPMNTPESGEKENEHDQLPEG